MAAQIGDLEMYTGIVILAMIAVWVVGSISNKRIVEKGFKQYKHVLANQFMEPGKLVKESNSHFHLLNWTRSMFWIPHLDPP